nr:hypothetical protein [Gilliamella apicola]
MHKLFDLTGKTALITGLVRGLVFSYVEELTTTVIVFNNTLKNDHI